MISPPSALAMMAMRPGVPFRCYRNATTGRFFSMRAVSITVSASTARASRGAAIRRLTTIHVLVQALEDRCDALAAANAHGDQSITAASALELVQRLHGQDRAGRADRMAKPHRAAVG